MQMLSAYLNFYDRPYTRAIDADKGTGHLNYKNNG